MKKYRIMLFGLIAAMSTVEAGGWQWYQAEAQPIEAEERQESRPVSAPKDALEKLSLLQKATKTALAQAILYPSPANFITFFTWQNYWTKQAAQFSQSAKKAFLARPDLDYNLKYSHYNGTVSHQLAKDAAQQKQAIAELAKKYGVMLFYRGREPMDNQLVNVVKQFKETYQLSVLPIAVDGVINPLLPESRRDNGQAAKLGVRYFPALMLFDPQSETVNPIAYGFISQDDLAKQFLNLYTDFAPNF